MNFPPQIGIKAINFHAKKWLNSCVLALAIFGFEMKFWHSVSLIERGMEGKS